MGLKQFVLFLHRLGLLQQRGAIPAPCFPRLIPHHEFLVPGTRRCAFGWQVYLIPCENLSSLRHLHLCGSLKRSSLGSFMQHLVEMPSKASFAPFFLHINIALGWVSVKINVRIKMHEEACTVLFLPTQGSGTLAPFYLSQ